MTDRLEEIQEHLATFDKTVTEKGALLQAAHERAHEAVRLAIQSGITFDHPAKVRSLWDAQLRLGLKISALYIPEGDHADEKGNLIDAANNAESMTHVWRTPVKVNDEHMVVLSWIPRYDLQKDPRDPNFKRFLGASLWTPRDDGYPFRVAKFTLPDLSHHPIELNAISEGQGVIAGDLVISNRQPDRPYFVEGHTTDGYVVASSSTGEGRVNFRRIYNEEQLAVIARWGRYTDTKKPPFDPQKDFRRFYQT